MAAAARVRVTLEGLHLGLTRQLLHLSLEPRQEVPAALQEGHALPVAFHRRFQAQATSLQLGHKSLQACQALVKGLVPALFPV